MSLNDALRDQMDPWPTCPSSPVSLLRHYHNLAAAIERGERIERGEA